MSPSAAPGCRVLGLLPNTEKPRPPQPRLSAFVDEAPRRPPASLETRCQQRLWEAQAEAHAAGCGEAWGAEAGRSSRQQARARARAAWLPACLPGCLPACLPACLADRVSEREVCDKGAQIAPKVRIHRSTID